MIYTRLRTSLFVASLIAATAFAPRVSEGHGLDVALAQVRDDEVAALVNGDGVTVGQLKIMLGLRTAPYRKDEYIYFNLQDLMNCSRESVAYRMFAEKARSEGISLSEKQQKELDEKVHQFELRQLYRDKVLNRIDPPTEEMLRGLYDNIKEEFFRNSEKMILREMVFPFYAPSDEEKAKERAEEARALLEGGQPFVSVARKVLGPQTSAEAMTLSPSSTDGRAVVYIEKFQALEDGEFSEPFRTEDSWRIIYRQFQIPANYIPFESTREILVDMYNENKRDEMIREFYSRLASDPVLFSVYTENLASQGELALDSDPMVSINGEDVTREELSSAAGWWMSKEVPISESSFRELAQNFGPVQEKLAAYVAEKENYENHPVVNYYRETVEETWLAREYLMRQISDEEIEPTQEDIEKAFLLSISRSVGPPGTVYYDTVTVYTQQNEADTIVSRVEEIDNLDAFREFARYYYQENDTTIWRAGVRTLFADLPPTIANVQDDDDAASILRIRRDEDSVSAWWIISVNPKRSPTAKEAEQFRERLRRKNLQDRIEEMVWRESESVTVTPILPGWE